jgi:hypothetical protein
MDKSDFIDNLNADLGTEFQSIVQYVQPTATIKGPEYGSIVEEMATHLDQEFGLPDVAEALRPLLTQTQDHVIDLRDALG